MAFLKISPFMVTLDVSTAVDGIALILTNGIPVYGMPAAYVNGFGRGLFLGLPWAVVLAILVVALIWLMQDATKLGTLRMNPKDRKGRCPDCNLGLHSHHCVTPSPQRPRDAMMA